MDSRLYYVNGKRPDEVDEEVIKIVKKIMGFDITDKPFDNLVAYYSRNYSYSNHIVLNLHGTFDDIEDTTVVEKGKTKLSMDFVEKAKVDNMQFDYITIIIKHQTKRLTDEKIEKLLRNYIQHIGLHNRPCFIYILTGEKYPKNMVYEVEGTVFKVNFICYDEDKIQKTLNILSIKDYSNEELSEVEFLDFLYCIILTKEEYFLKVLYKSIEIIKKIENINPVFREELFSTICILIKYHFRNNENKKKELITMIAEIWREIPEDCNSIERNIIWVCPIIQFFGFDPTEKFLIEIHT